MISIIFGSMLLMLLIIISICIMISMKDCEVESYFDIDKLYNTIKNKNKPKKKVKRKWRK